MPDMEDIRRALKLRLLSEDFRTILQEVYDEKNDLYGESLEAQFPQEVFTSQMFNIQGVGFPVGELTGTISRNNEEDGPGIDLTHEVQIYWHERDDDEQRLEDRLNRLIRATRLYFMRSTYLWEADTAPIILNDDVFSPFVPLNVYEGKPFVKSGLVTLYVRTFG